MRFFNFFCIITRNGQKHNQSIPIVLPISDEIKAKIENKKAVSLRYNGKIYAILRNPEVYAHRKEERCARTWGAYIKDSKICTACKYSNNT